MGNRGEKTQKKVEKKVVAILKGSEVIACFRWTEATSSEGFQKRKENEENKKHGL